MNTILNRWSLLAVFLGQVVPGVFACDQHGEEAAFAKQSRIVQVSDREESKAWLGIAPALVPAPVAVQLGLSQGEGIMIGNVVANSPAAVAGLQQYDVLTRVDGDAISGEIGDFIEIISGSRQGESINMTLFRNGHEIDMTVTLSERPDEIQWVYDLAPEARLREELKSSGHFLKRSPDGRWVFQDMGDLDLGGLPNQLRMALPGIGGQSFCYQLNNGDQHVEITSEQDGVTIRVAQEDGGPITVTRTSQDDHGGEVVDEVVYDTREQLAENDSVAFELLERANVHTFHQFDAESFKDQMRDLEEMLSNRSQWSQDAQRQMAEALEAYQKAMAGTKTRLHTYQQLMPHGLDLSGKYGLRLGGDPRYLFKVRPDGTIEAHVSRGGDKMIREYADEDDFAERDPEGYERFLDLHEPLD
jgi:hypothetical protein